MKDNQLFLVGLLEQQLSQSLGRLFVRLGTAPQANGRKWRLGAAISQIGFLFRK